MCIHVKIIHRWGSTRSSLFRENVQNLSDNFAHQNFSYEANIS